MELHFLISVRTLLYNLQEKVEMPKRHLFIKWLTSFSRKKEEMKENT